MPRRRRSRENDSIDRIEFALKGGVGLLIVIAFAGGGVVGFGERLLGLIFLTVLSVIFLAAAYALFVVIRRTDWIGSRPVSQAIHQSTYERKEPAFVWSEAEIKSHLSKIDWYQFEKFCATILEAEGFEVERKGGASPDGGVDLVARKNQTRTLIQCKHWQTWKVREPVIRQLLGSMVDFDVSKGAVFFSGESTEPAKDFAAKHGIGLVDGYQLAERALKALSENSLNSILKCEVHHCPKCESEMVWRTGDFKPFWGCSRFPKCRGVLKHSGPR